MGVRTRSGASTVPDEVIADVLAAPRRREILTGIAEQGRDVPVSDVVNAVCDSNRRKSCRELRQELFDDHLPKLVAAGLIEYDSQRDAVLLQVESERLSALLETFGEE